MQYEFDYHKTLDELGQAANTLLDKPLGAFFNTQIRTSLGAKYIFLVAASGLEVNGEEYAVKLRQQLLCSTCARFFNRMGSVVYMTAAGAQSVYWNPDVVSDPVMKLVVAGMKRAVESSRIVSLFNPKGSYATYTEETNYGEKPYRHYYVNAEQMVPRHPLTSVRMRMPDAGQFNSRVEALVKFAMTTPYTAVTIMEQWLASGTINHVGDSAATIDMIKTLLASLAALENSLQWEALDNPYVQETAKVNLIWRKALENQNLLTLKNSLLGKTITSIVKLETAGRTDQGIRDIIAAWKTQSSALHYKRTTAEASTSEVTRALNYLEENDWLRSLEQVETAEADIPVLWESKAVYKDTDKVAESTGGFAQFASAKAAQGDLPKGIYRAPGVTDAGYFFNELLPNVESIAVLIPTETRLVPTFFNTQAHADAKPIFKWDTIEKPAKHTMYRYENPLTMGQLATPETPVKSKLYEVNILSITSALTIGIAEPDSPLGLLFMMDTMKCPIEPRPALFATSVKSELYDYRRPIEDYSKTTKIPRCTGQQAIGFPIGPVDPRANNSGRIATLAFAVKFTPEYAVIMGHPRAIYMIDLNGYHVKPDLSKFPRITDRWVKSDGVVEAAPEVESAATPMPQPVQ